MASLATGSHSRAQCQPRRDGPVALLSSLPRSCPRGLARPSPVRAPAVACRSIGKDSVEGWLDIAKLVSGSGGNKTAYDELASNIGKDVYVDVAGWHLYLRDMSAGPSAKMSQALAVQLGPQAAQAKGGLRESDVADVLKKIPVKLGAGKTQVSLFEVMPSMCVGDLTKILESYTRSK